MSAPGARRARPRIELPANFTPTHATAGLVGFPAVDLFGPLGAEVVARFFGRVVRISGRRCSDGGAPGGPYGRSVYIRNTVNGRVRYATHLDLLYLSVGERVWPGRSIGTVCDAAVAGKPGTTHVHLGMFTP